VHEDVLIDLGKSEQLGEAVLLRAFELHRLSAVAKPILNGVPVHPWHQVFHMRAAEEG